MILAVAALALAYSFPAGSSHVYDLSVNMEGYVPILGRPQSKVDLKLVIQVGGEGRSPEGQWKAVYDVTEMKASMSGVTLPFTVDNIRAYFPKASLLIGENGKVLKSDAPDVELPVRLPGLDSRRLPDITFLPLEFSAEGVEIGRAFSFKKSFSGGEMEFTASPTKVDEDAATFDVKLAQSSTSFEDEKGSLVKARENAFVEVMTKVGGTATVVFDRKLGIARSMDAELNAQSTVGELKSGSKTGRSLRLKVTVKRRLGA